MNTNFLKYQIDFKSLPLYLVILIYPYVFFLYTLEPFNIFGFNGYIILITAGVLACFSMLLFAQLQREFIYFVSVVVLAFSLYVFQSTSTYTEFSVATLVSYRAPIMMFVYALSMNALVNKNNERTIGNIIIFNAAFIGLIGLVHHFLFPKIVLIPVAINQFMGISSEFLSGRETSILVNATVYADFILLGLFLIYIRVVRLGEKKTRNNLLAILFICAIFISASRYPSIIAIILIFLIFLKQKYGDKSFLRFFFIFSVLLVLVFLLMETLDTSLAQRFAQSSGRSAKVYIALSLLFASPGNFFFGVEPSVIAQTVIDGVSFSDNSILTVALNFGVVFCFFWIFYLISLLNRYFSAKKNWFFFVFFFLLLLETNAILWDFWILTFFCVWKIFDINTRDIQGERSEKLCIERFK